LKHKRNRFHWDRNRPDTGLLYHRRDRRPKDIAMTAIAKALSNVIPAISHIDVFKAIALFCGACLFVSILLATYGLWI
jgi:hypothetical protein